MRSLFSLWFTSCLFSHDINPPKTYDKKNNKKKFDRIIYMPHPKSRVQNSLLFKAILQLFKNCKVLESTELIYKTRLKKLGFLNRFGAEKEPLGEIGFDLKQFSILLKLDLFKLAYSFLFNRKDYCAENLKIIDQLYGENQKSFERLLKELILPAIENKMIQDLYKWLSSETSEIYKSVIAKANIEGNEDSAEVVDIQHEISQTQLNRKIEENRGRILNELLTDTFYKKALEGLQALHEKDLVPTAVEYRKNTVSPSLIQSVARQKDTEEVYAAFPNCSASIEIKHQIQGSEWKPECGAKLSITLRRMLDFLLGRGNMKDGIKLHIEHALSVAKFKKKSLVLECQAQFRIVEELADRINKLSKLYKDSITKYKTGSTYYDREYTPNLVYENLRKLGKAKIEHTRAIIKFWEKLFALEGEEGVWTNLLTLGTLGDKEESF